MTNATEAISKYQDIIDSRDVIARIGYLEVLEGPSLDDAEREELKALRELAEEASAYAADWAYGEDLIRDSYFEEYAQELAEECGLIDNNAGWPARCIDWEQAAQELQMDYTSVEFKGIEYWIR